MWRGFNFSGSNYNGATAPDQCAKNLGKIKPNPQRTLEDKQNLLSIRLKG